jgi:(p)ppGpp synthase/HD superfamily hydrolase
MKLSRRFDEAFLYAAELHEDQERKGGGEPYLAHLMAVCSLALEHGADEDQAIAALLHDAVEDQGGDRILGDIRSRFGADVADIVAGCSDSRLATKPPWRLRKEAYLDRLRVEPPRVLLIVTADKLHNARAILRDYREIGDALWERFTGEKDDVLWYYRELARALGSTGPARLADELTRTVDELMGLVAADTAVPVSGTEGIPRDR